LTLPLSVIECDIAIITPDRIVSLVKYSGSEKIALTWLGFNRTSYRQLQGQNGVRIPVADPVASAVECPNIVLGS
jgi:hypothetical protein